MAYRPTHRQLEYAVALAETGHFGAAARRCHVSQPTLSVQIALLESQLGSALFDRTPGRVVPTDVGLQVVEAARHVLLTLDDIVTLAAQGARNLGGLIRLGVAPTFGPYFLPSLLPSLHARYPALQLYIREERPATIERDVAAGTLDCGLGPAPNSGHALAFRLLCREAIHLGVPRDHRLAGLRQVMPEALRGERLLTLGRGHHLFERVRELATACGADIREDYEGTSLDTLRQMLVMGMGLSLFPGLYAQTDLRMDQDVVLLRLDGWPASRDIGFFWRAGNGRAAQFEQLARESDVTCAALGLTP
ncbi:hydrogen peroxide-inducible genes activator [Zavarzinia sp. CC-PAN008]|uniref:hydrogen peroxide-inducible genes activator n=1 Tax=Zavarzinia sp. CC-PAN008 TaxID=3243332 RepID=UPI003F7435D8